MGAADVLLSYCIRNGDDAHKINRVGGKELHYFACVRV